MESVKNESGPSKSETNDKSITPPLPQEDLPKKSKKDDKSKKEDKNVEIFMKSLGSVPTVEEKFTLVCKKYIQIADENKKLQFYVKQSDKRYLLLLKEKEQLQHEFNKNILIKSKLENLCRELQKQSKAIKEESLLKIREEEERRKETQAKFQNTLSEITTLLQQNNEKNNKLRDDNISMSEKFKSIMQQYQLREQQVEKMAKQMTLESQLSDAKLQKADLEHRAEKERLSAEAEQMKVTIAQCRAKIMEMQGTETSLRSQLAVYTDKYDEFQSALVKSNQVFGTFKDQMEHMSKKIKKLEEESLSWKKRWETSQTALLNMCSERQTNIEMMSATSRQLQHMQSLCRTLQAERTVLLATLKKHNIERPPLPAPQPPTVVAPAPAAASNSKVEVIEANCAQLEQSLSHLETQLNVLTNKNTNKEEPTKTEKPKKSKSKKNKADKHGREQKETATPAKENTTNQVKLTENMIRESKDNSDVSIENVQDEDKLLSNIEDKVDDTTLESLVQAISDANITLSDLEVNAALDNLETEDHTKNGVLTAENNAAITGKVEVTELIDVKSEDVPNIVDENLDQEEINSGKHTGHDDVEAIKETINMSIVNCSLNESQSNEEIPHINEVKSIQIENPQN